MKLRLKDFGYACLKVALGVLTFWGFGWAFNFFTLFFWLEFVLISIITLFISVTAIYKYSKAEAIQQRPNFSKMFTGLVIVLLFSNIVLYTALGYTILSVLSVLLAISVPLNLGFWDVMYAVQQKEFKERI